jgi:hypothetical protein
MPGYEEHWDRAWRLGWDPFQYQITKYVERWKDKNGVQDLEKARHFLDKYIEVVKSAGREWWNTDAFDSARLDVQGVDYAAADVKQTGYTNFTYEGGSAEWDLYTCKSCRKEVRVNPNESPATHHQCGVEEPL